VSKRYKGPLNMLVLALTEKKIFYDIKTKESAKELKILASTSYDS
jgi:hypothetical protein